MPSSFDIWKMLGGVAFFLLAMNFMESALQQLAGRRFKLFLKKQTTNNAKAIGSGAAVTALLQSSSIVNLMVLGMAGAGVVKMQNALALMLGSNLGTTFSSWIVAIFGFTFNIENFALPVAGITGISLIFLRKDSKWFWACRLFFSLAFLFVALGFIKEGMEEFVKQTDLSAFSRYPLFVFFLLGIALTAIIQSSSVTVALTLSALYSNAITLYAAMAIVLGSEIGTTLKLFLASAKGTAVKKRVALGNFLVNIITAAVMFMLLKPVNYLITPIPGINDNLIALVIFQSLVNICSILLFFPFLNALGNFLLKLYPDAEEESRFIHKAFLADPELALEALENETRYFIGDVMAYTFDSFRIKEMIKADHPVHKNFYRKSLSEKYEYLKQLHGEMHGFCLKLQTTAVTKTESERLNQLIAAIRNSMYAAKSIRDAQHDILQTRNSSNDIKYNFYLQARKRLSEFYDRILRLTENKNKETAFQELTTVYKSITSGYTEILQSLYKEGLPARVNEVEISTLINFNRELYTSMKSVVFALKDYGLTPAEAEYFDSLPGFIR